MAPLSEIELLMVCGSSAVSRAFEARSGHGNVRYRWRRATSRESFLEGLASHPPDMIFLSESGIPNLLPREVFVAARKHDPEIPVIMFGMRRRERSLHSLLNEGASEYLRLTDLERIPVVIARALREQRSRINEARLQNDIQHVTDLLRESQRFVTIGRLAGSIAHEINNPLESITNLLFLMEHESGLPAAARTYLATAQEELDRVVQISKQTLNFCREAPAPAPFRLGALLDQVLVLYTHHIAQKRLTVVRQFDDREPMAVFPGEMRQVFSNLIVNAIEATSDGGKLLLRVRKSRLWSDPHVVGQRVTIADNGSGMPTEVRRRIGEAFFTTKGQSGTGLGLWLTQSIVRRYGGTLLLHSSTGKRHGTVFNVFLPTNLRPRAVAGAFESNPSNPTIEMGTSRDEPVRRSSQAHAKGA